MAKIKNVSGNDRILDSRLVLAGQVVELPDSEAAGYLCQPPNWAPADAAAKKVVTKLTTPDPDPEPDAGDDSADDNQED